ncbi:MAG: TonB-dependent receptor plug domain-containing protein, partial [Bacteroidota bacterium]
MKYLLGIFFVISTTFPAVSQQATYSIACKERPLDQVMADLKKQYQIKFSFDPEFVSEYTLTLQLTTESRSDFIDKLLQSFPLEHKKIRDVIVILPKERQVMIRLFGRVADARDGSPLAFAFVQLDDAQSMVTDQNGNFSVHVARRHLAMKVSYLGYQNSVLNVVPNGQRLVVRMQPDDNQLPEFIIDESRNTGHKVGGYSSINPNQISTLPALGETDIFKGLQLLPGITATDEAASGLTIRGGTPEQNLVLLDGFTIYHLDHFFGIFSTFNPNTINHVDIYKGGFDVRYGGRVSAVVDAKAKAWAGDRLRGGININSTSVSAFVQSPIGKKSFLNMGLRSSHYGLISNPLYDEFIERNRVDAINLDNPEFNQVKEIDLVPDFVFADFNAKWRYAPNDKETWDFNVYLSEDDYEGLRPLELEFSTFLLQDNARWANTGLSTNWFKDWTDQYSTEATLSFSKYNGNASLLIQETFADSVDLSRVEGFQLIDKNTIFYQDYSKFNRILDFTLKWHNNLRINESHDLSFGLETKLIDTNLF